MDGPAGEFFYVGNDAADFSSAEGLRWHLVGAPFPRPTQRPSRWRPGWEAGAVVNQHSFRFLSPCLPANVLGMAHNTGQAGRALPRQAFHKAATSVIGPGEAIEVAAGAARVEPEAELAVVVGRRCRNLVSGEARQAILGFTIGNDVTDRDLQRDDELWISAKSQDTFTPLGPWIVTDLDERDQPIRIVHNGNGLRAAGTGDLGWKVEEIMVYLTSFMTLHPGDVVLTGFPAEAAPIKPGDTVACQVGGIGELLNPVRLAPGVPAGFTAD